MGAGLKWAMALAWLAVVTWLSLLPAPPVPQAMVWWDHADKAGHAVAYAAMAWLFLRAAGHTIVPVVLAGCVAYGVAMEFAQAAMWPGVRECSTGDILANALGVVLAWLLGRRFRGARRTAGAQ